MYQKFLLAGCLLLWASCLLGTEIKGKFEGYKDETVLIRGNHSLDTLQIKPDGTFSYHCQVHQPYTLLYISGFSKYLIGIMANQEDSIILTAKQKPDGKLSVTFEGDRKELNDYLTAYMQQNGSNSWPMEQLAKVSFKEHATAVDKMEKELAALLKKAEDKESQDIIDELKLDLHSSMLNLKQRYCWAVRAINHAPMDKDADYVTFNRGLNMNDAAWLEKEKEQDITGYPGLVDGRIRWEMAINEGVTDTSAMYTLCYMKWARKLIANDTVANFFINRRISRYMSSGGDENMQKNYEGFMKYSNDESMKKEISREYKLNLALAKGQPAPDFTMKDKEGNAYRLSDFKGKVLYIDVWATWCGPCCAEIPFMEKRYEQFKNNKNIVFISISVDDNKTAWKKKIEKDKTAWKQFIVDGGFKSDLCKNYGIRAIPRFLLIDQKGKIISVKAPRPSNKIIINQLNDYCK